MPTENLTFTEDTLIKVYRALMKNGIVGQKAVDIVSDIQNEGVLFRETRRGRPPGARGATKKKETADDEGRVEKAPKILSQEVVGKVEQFPVTQAEVDKAWEPRE